MTGQRIVDWKGADLLIGSRVLYGTGDVAVVKGISDFDVDHDDRIGRARLYPPTVTVRFEMGGDEEQVPTHDETPISWQSYPDGPEEYVFAADDLEIIG